MANEITIIRKGESLPFVFDRSGKSIEGWICTINVKRFPDDASQITRAIVPNGTTWPGFLTSSETEGLNSIGLYRLIGLLTNSSTGEEEQVPVRFNLANAWA